MSLSRLKTKAFAASLLLITFHGSAQRQPHEAWGAEPRSQAVENAKQTSPKVSSEWGIFISQQVNVDANGNNILGDAANEPSLAVNPNNPRQIAIGWRQFGNILSDFREAGVAYSDDGGHTWHNNGPIEPGVFRSDPVLASDGDGVFYYQSLAVTNRTGNNPQFDIDQWRSVNGGQHWFDKTFVYGGDKSWYAIDNTQNNSRGHFYAAWNVAGNQHFPKTFNYSTDNGMSFSLPEEIPNKPIFGTVAVGFDSEVYVVGVDGDAPHLASPYLLRSNNSTSALFPDFQQITPLNLGGSLAIGEINPVGLLGQMWVATDRSERSTRGHVYVFSSIKSHLNSDPLDVFFLRSTDGGSSFEPFRKINSDDSIRNFQWFGTMGVAPNGRIDLVWYDTRVDESLALPRWSSLYYSYSYDGGVTFSKEQAISQSFNHFLGYPVQQKLGDYIDVVSDNGGAHIAYAATFTGGQDVYYLYARPSLHKENPHFPSHIMDNAWYDPDAPYQGIFTKTLVQNPGSDSPQLVNFEAIFTYTPSGKQMWLTMQSNHPASGDQITFPVLMPTGDLSDDNSTNRVIGVAVKSRAYDDAGDLVPDRVNYAFDFSEAAMNQAQSLLENPAFFDPNFYRNSPYFGSNKSITVQPLVPIDQHRRDFCHVQGQTLVAENEPAEGRLQFSFLRDSALRVFGADFTYQRDTQGQLILNDGLATPVWFTINDVGGVDDSGNANHQLDQGFGGSGFFDGSQVPAIQAWGQEQISNSHTNGFETLKPDGTREVLSTLALGSYCGAPQ